MGARCQCDRFRARYGSTDLGERGTTGAPVPLGAFDAAVFACHPPSLRVASAAAPVAVATPSVRELRFTTTRRCWSALPPQRASTVPDWGRAGGLLTAITRGVSVRALAAGVARVDATRESRASVLLWP